MHPLHHHHHQQQQHHQSNNHHVHDHHPSNQQQSLPSSSTGDLLIRKKRRGMVEKKRRDRINASLNELKRLVPAASEKQGSAKLEKAEILQLTVDHLKVLHSKGFDTFSFEPYAFASKYHKLDKIGFDECFKQVDQYLSNVEEMDHQNPLRVRLYTHLSRYSTQRESALKLASSAASAFTTPSQFQPLPITSSSPSSSTSTGMTSVPANTSSTSSCENLTILGSNSLHCNSSSVTDVNNNLHYPPPPPPPPTTHQSYPHSYAHSYPQAHHNVHQYLPAGYPPTSFPTPIQDQSQLTGLKLCRPWGPELAY
ncbi:LOW QUALITY PROTEIN: hairy/enhancer-of-split related with YRPW motif protein-like [Tetranychus urticae]|uniref:LOW QUALITY PROTEIN: hairy/enhancer-of-split related with YRPW motif protein-like n=1 Tax=Tetranychus urticae TaxID=32264 RepID=UPI00077BBEA3|nr:LOW QUALITY PROTEIN: hairy/enhancer-of-split related with YRPW motif protein-like [Tetranychus urticae]